MSLCLMSTPPKLKLRIISRSRFELMTFRERKKKEKSQTKKLLTPDEMKFRSFGILCDLRLTELNAIQKFRLFCQSVSLIHMRVRK